MPYAKTPPLVPADWLSRHLSDASLVVLDCRWRLTDADFGAKAYAEGHIPNARFVDLNRDLSAPSARYGGRHPLPLPEAFQRRMGELGVGSDSYVICYDDDGAGAARCWWCLCFYGHCRVSVLDGGFPLWTASGYAVTQETPVIEPQPFKARPDPRMVADYQTVYNLRTAIPLVDARTPERYLGTVEPVDFKAGHIPGAANVPYSSVLTDQGTFRPREELSRLFEPVATQDADPIVYCGSGVSACVTILAMRKAGLTAMLYPGSWSDWIQHEDSPIDGP